MNDVNYTPPGSVDAANIDGSITPGFWRTQQQPTQIEPGNRPRRGVTAEASHIRDRLVQYFSSPEGSVEWQLAHINQV